ncbi:hypothetical protein CS542_07565 [Pedobacter sp. IW39]|nr:hypothetical protein CS542_07565 [Pedobacter sp. IW39]
MVDYEIDQILQNIKDIKCFILNPELKAPLKEPGLNIEEGVYLVVNGVPLTADQSIYSLFENTAGQQVRLMVNKTWFDGAREVTVVPVSFDAETNLRRSTGWKVSASRWMS